MYWHFKDVGHCSEIERLFSQFRARLILNALFKDSFIFLKVFDWRSETKGYILCVLSSGESSFRAIAVRAVRRPLTKNVWVELARVDVTLVRGNWDVNEKSMLTCVCDCINTSVSLIHRTHRNTEEGSDSLHKHTLLFILWRFRPEMICFLVFRVKQWGRPLRDKPNQVHKWHHHKHVVIKCAVCVILSVLLVFRSAEDGGVYGLLWSSSSSSGVRSAAAALCGWCGGVDPGWSRLTVVGGETKNPSFCLFNDDQCWVIH